MMLADNANLKSSKKNDDKLFFLRDLFVFFSFLFSKVQQLPHWGQVSTMACFLHDWACTQV